MLQRIFKNSLKLNRNLTNRCLTTTVRCNNKSEESEDLTHFGFETVKTKEKAEKGKKVSFSMNFN